MARSTCKAVLVASYQINVQIKKCNPQPITLCGDKLRYGLDDIALYKVDPINVPKVLVAIHGLLRELQTAFDRLSTKICRPFFDLALS
jgi:hypothetical protein